MLDAASGFPAALLSVVVPVFNEQAGLAAFHARLARAMEPLGAWEAIYVNDGSTDTSLGTLLALRSIDPRIAVINLSRNFGKEIATTAGLDHARGEAVIVIDADLQDPPELIAELVAGWREGFDTVYAQRRTRPGDSLVKRLSARLFYGVIGRLSEGTIPAEAGDFRLMSRRVVDAVLQLREHHRCMKGLFAWVGFPAQAVPYDRAPRHAGRSGWGWFGLWRLAIEGITGCSVAPLKVATWLGLGVALFATVFGIQLIARTVLFGNPVPGYPSLMAVILGLGGVQLLTLGIIGEYLGRVFNETKRRPLYLIERVLPCEGAVAPAT